MDMSNIIKQLQDISSRVMYAAEGNSLGEVLERIAHTSRDLVQAKYAALGVPGEDGSLKYFKVSGMTEDEIRNMPHLPRQKGLIGSIMSDRTPILLENMHLDKRSDGFCGPHPHMTSLLGVPIQMGEQLFGVLYICDRIDESPFTDEDLVLVEMLAGYAALAIASTELHDQQSRLKLLEERERISMELHDGIIQSLYALGMNLELLRGSGEIHADDITPIIRGLDTAIGDIRNYIMQLRTKHDQAPTIRQTIHEMVDRLHISENLRVNIQAPDKVAPFSPSEFESICLIANEALSNAVRHAEATNIDIYVHLDKRECQIVITDNGKGFDIQATNQQSNGLGLRNMRHRARIYDGDIKIESERGHGTTLTIQVPIRL